MKKIFCLMGPTASGKTPLAVQLVQAFPFEIISVDSAMVYRDMNIGTSKPDAETLKIAPHRLIDVVDPREPYSAGRFRDDALSEIENVFSQGKIPLLVGGTMLYFRVLQQGIANLPTANAAIRLQLKNRIEAEGLENLHAELMQIDPVAAKRIHVNDKQRIERALEVYQLTGKPISILQTETLSPLADKSIHQLALIPADRAFLHERIKARFYQMLDEGLIEEVEKLYARGDLSEHLPSIRSVGYREIWDYLAGKCTRDAMIEKAIAATRQLAKRQLTWLRTWPQLNIFESADKNLFSNVARWIENEIKKE